VGAVELNTAKVNRLVVCLVLTSQTSTRYRIQKKRQKKATKMPGIFGFVEGSLGFPKFYSNFNSSKNI
jgi:hypothetical protein